MAFALIALCFVFNAVQHCELQQRRSSHCALPLGALCGTMPKLTWPTTKCQQLRIPNFQSKGSNWPGPGPGLGPSPGTGAGWVVQRCCLYFATKYRNRNHNIRRQSAKQISIAAPERERQGGMGRGGAQPQLVCCCLIVAAAAVIFVVAVVVQQRLQQPLALLASNNCCSCCCRNMLPLEFVAFDGQLRLCRRLLCALRAPCVCPMCTLCAPRFRMPKIESTKLASV